MMRFIHLHEDYLWDSSLFQWEDQPDLMMQVAAGLIDDQIIALLERGFFRETREDFAKDLSNAADLLSSIRKVRQES